MVNPAEAAVAEDAEDVAFLRLTDDVFHDLIGGGDIIRLGVGGADVFHQPGRIESFFGGYLLEPRDSRHDNALGQADG